MELSACSTLRSIDSSPRKRRGTARSRAGETPGNRDHARNHFHFSSQNTVELTSPHGVECLALHIMVRRGGDSPGHRAPDCASDRSSTTRKQPTWTRSRHLGSGRQRSSSNCSTVDNFVVLHVRGRAQLRMKMGASGGTLVLSACRNEGRTAMARYQPAL
jgi:hypothetical protein